MAIKTFEEFLSEIDGYDNPKEELREAKAYRRYLIRIRGAVTSTSTDGISVTRSFEAVERYIAVLKEEIGDSYPLDGVRLLNRGWL